MTRPIIETFIQEFGETYREELEERSAIIADDAEVPESMAEVIAVRHMKEKYGLHTQAELFEAAEMSTMARAARRAH